MNLEQHQGGMLECLGQMWTWVSGEAEAALTPLTAGKLHAMIGSEQHFHAMIGPDRSYVLLGGQQTHEIEP